MADTSANGCEDNLPKLAGNRELAGEEVSVMVSTCEGGFSSAKPSARKSAPHWLQNRLPSRGIGNLHLGHSLLMPTEFMSTEVNRIVKN
ncbi:MAG: hypothetical protein AB7P14_25445 [Blastocatellales bacterium]